jgi:hypothetical protein
MNLAKDEANEGALYLFFNIDRTSKFAVARFYG